MLYAYPIAATAENWVHDTVYGKVKAALDAFENDNDPPAWSDGLRAELTGRPKMDEAYNAFCTAGRRLGPRQRQKVLEALDAQNNIPAVFDGTTICPRLETLPAGIRKSIKALFDVAFDALKSLKVRDRQYELAYENLPGKACPFCWIEPFEAPGLAREDLDHYLPRSLYPFAGANLRNLAPMGGKCNRAYKGVADVICDSVGHRRPCFDPYGQVLAGVSLLASRPFEGAVGELFPLPAWRIDLIGEEQAVGTWDEVFDIRRRYEKKIEAHFKNWMEDFAIWCAREVGPVDTAGDVVEALTRYLEFSLLRPDADGAHLARAMFEMFRRHCEVGPDSPRLAAWFSAWVAAQHQLVVEAA